MLPTPFINYVPKLFRDDPKAVAFAARMDVFLSAWRADVLRFRRLQRFDECDSQFVSELAFLLAVTLVSSESDAASRKRVKNGAASHALRGTWAGSVKGALDTITGLNSDLMSRVFRSGEWVLVSNETSIEEPLVASLGTDGVTSGLGLDLSGTGQEIDVKGNVYINLHLGIHTAVVTADQLNRVATIMNADLLPAYFRVFLGYIDANGIFNLYQSF